MNGIASALVVIATLLPFAPALPIGCSEDVHCPSGSYCEPTQLFCRPCLRCEDLKREPPRTTSCITSVAECGACIEGVVPDGENNRCVTPNMTRKGLLPYEWTVVTVGLLLAALICFAALFVLRNFYTFKICASTRTLVRSPVAVNSASPATAPLPPPPYNAVVALPPAQCEESWPFIEPTAKQTPETRQPLENQTAQIFNNPTYDSAHQPPSYDILPVNHDSLPTIEEHSTEIDQNGSDNYTESEDATANELPLVRGTSPTLLRAREDTNNNTSDESEDSAASQPSFLTHGGTSFIINVIKNVNTVQQRNQLAS